MCALQNQFQISLQDFLILEFRTINFSIRIFAHAIRQLRLLFFRAVHTTFNLHKSSSVFMAKVLLLFDLISLTVVITVLLLFLGGGRGERLGGGEEFQRPTYRVVYKSWNLKHRKSRKASKKCCNITSISFISRTFSAGFRKFTCEVTMTKLALITLHMRVVI